MSKSDQKQIIAALLKRHGWTFASELRINLESQTPTTLFRWLCAALLSSARIGNAIADEAARALTKSGWTTAKKMAGATWEERSACSTAPDTRATTRRPRVCWQIPRAFVRRDRQLVPPRSGTCRGPHFCARVRSASQCGSFSKPCQGRSSNPEIE